MPSAVLTPSTEALLTAWRTGDETGNPAGPLFTGGLDTELDLVEADFAMLSGCSSCTASTGGWCC
jgi:hypothetical protein